MEEVKVQPFYVGEEVVAIDAKKGSIIKNGNIYIISSCQYLQNNGRWYWYVGVTGVDNNFLRPTIFASMIKIELMEFEKLNKECPVGSN